MSSIKAVTFTQHSADLLAARVWGLNWNHNGRFLVTVGEDRTVKIWKYADDKLSLLQKISGDQNRTIRYAHFSHCGRFLAVGSWDATIVIYEINESNEFEEKHRLEGHENEVKCVQFSNNGQWLATCSRDKTVWLWQVDEDGDYEVVSILQKHSADVKFVLWNPVYELLVSGGYDNSLRMYYYDDEDWVTADEVEAAHDSAVWSGDFDSTGKYLVTAGADHNLKVWEVTSPEPPSAARLNKVASYEARDTVWPFYSVSWDHLTNLIAVAGGDQKVRIFSFDAESLAITPVTDTKLDAEINAIAWNPASADTIAAALDDGTVQILRVSA
uniref:Probable cytosolic iron-sulfur protein assembly protein CIAO1 homolog n=1 Tax=Panagrellus redivivus TaxID=6233 RepID=A0A7E4W6N8_PANRE